MKSQRSRKVVVALGMAVVVGIAVVTFALRAHSVSPIAQSVAPPTPLAAAPSAPAAVAQMPAAPAEVVQAPDAPAAVTDINVVATRKAGAATPRAAEAKHVRIRDLPKAAVDAVTPDDTVARAAPVADAVVNPASIAVGSSVAPVNSAAEVMVTAATATPSTPPTSPTDERKMGAGTVIPASDGQITQNVKSEIAVNSLTRDVNIGVTTTDGVVALTGNLASQEVIDHVKDMVAKVRDVKSVDTSALIVASL